MDNNVRNIFVISTLNELGNTMTLLPFSLLLVSGQFKNHVTA